MTLPGLTLLALLGTTTPSAMGGVTAGEPVGGRQGAPPSGLFQDSGAAPAPKKKPRVIRLEELKIEGRIQKPQAFYLLQRSNLAFDDLNREESFLRKVVESVEKAPF